jgi:hypothetical protein
MACPQKTAATIMMVWLYSVEKSLSKPYTFGRVGRACEVTNIEGKPVGKSRTYVELTVDVRAISRVMKRKIRGRYSPSSGQSTRPHLRPYQGRPRRAAIPLLDSYG